MKKPVCFFLKACRGHFVEDALMFPRRKITCFAVQIATELKGFATQMGK